MTTPSSHAADPSPRIPAIQGLRGFAALAVFIYHVYGMGTLWDFWPASFAPADPIFAAGKHGVELFFMISGYLICGSLVRHGDALAFLRDRAIRIYPVFLTIQVLVFGLGPFIHYKWLDGISAAHWALAFVSNAMFLPGIFDLPLAQLNAWSLSYEALFYVLSAAIFVGLSRVGRPAVVVLATLAVAFLVWRYPRAAFFLPGIAAFFLTRRRALALPRWLRALSIPALIATFALLTLGESRDWLIYAAVPPGFFFLVAILDGRGALPAMLRTPFLQFLGTISYSFYLWSPVVTFPMKILTQRFLHCGMGDIAVTLGFAVVGFTLSVIVATISYRLLESRLAAALKRFYRNPALQMRVR